MKIRWKVLVLVLFGTVLLNVALFAVARQQLLPVMTHLETELIEKQLGLGLGDLYEFVDELARLTEDYAAWDDTYEFILSPSEAYVSSNVVESTFTNFGLNFLVFINLQGEIVHGALYDNGRHSLGGLDEGLRRSLLRESRLWSFQEPGQALAGFYSVDGQIYALAAQPILTSNEEGPIRGALISGRFLGEDELADFAEDWGHTVAIEVGNAYEPAGDLSSGPLQHHSDIGILDSETMTGRIHVRDIFGRPLMDLISRFDRDFYTHGKIILETLLLWNLLICVLFAAVFYLAVDKALRSRELRLRVDAKYQKLSAEFEAILDGIPNPLTLISPDLNVLWVNRAGSALLADVAPMENGKYFSRVEFVSGFAEGTSAVERCLLSKQTEHHEAELPDGRVVEEFAYPLLDDSGEIISVIRLMVDVTEASYLKREAGQNNRLASIGELAAGVAHEINNPTGMVLMNLGLLTDVFCDLEPILDAYHEENPNFEPGQIPYAILRNKIPYLLREMIDGGLRIKRIVEDLKGFARTEDAGKIEAVNVNEVAAAAQRLVGYQLKKATANFSFTPGEGLPLVKGHFRRLEQVVVNLLVNASQALEARDKAIGLSTRLSEDGDWVLIEVQDQGRGIDPDIIGKVTDPFFTTRRNDGGTGLGLSLSSRIAKEHAGFIRIYSKVGTGSLFSLQLPCMKGSDDA